MGRSSSPSSSHTRNSGERHRRAVSIPAALGYPRSRSAPGPRPKAPSSPRWSSTATRRQGENFPQERERTASRSRVVLPLPGSPTSSTPAEKSTPARNRQSAQPRCSLGMRNTRLVTSRRLLTFPASTTAVPQTPARQPPSNDTYPWRSSSSWLYTDWPQIWKNSWSRSSRLTGGRLFPGALDTSPPGPTKQGPSRPQIPKGWPRLARMSQAWSLMSAPTCSRASRYRGICSATLSKLSVSMALPPLAAVLHVYGARPRNRTSPQSEKPPPCSLQTAGRTGAFLGKVRYFIRSTRAHQHGTVRGLPIWTKPPKRGNPARVP